MKTTFGSLFAGVGGFDMGMEQAGWNCKFQVEWDLHCRSVLDRHWPDVPKWNDVRNVDGACLPPVDCIIFGSPCQDLSLSGKRKGLEGERSGLFYEATRIIREMRNATGNVYPKYSIWENVRGALSSNFGRDFAAVLNELGESGAYLSEYCVLDAQNFGLSQVRKRVFIVSVYDFAASKRCPDQIFSFGESVPRDFKKIKKKKQNSASTIRTSVEPNDYESKTVGTLTSGDLMRGSTSTQAVLSNYLQVCEWWNGKQIVPTLTTKAHEQNMPDSGKLFALIESSLEFKNQLTLRRLTPLECERLQGYPDDHTRWRSDETEQSVTQRYKQIGNGVATPVAKWVGEQVMKVEQTCNTLKP